MTRAKVVHALAAERVTSHWFVLRIETSAGMYVKEFVHSDLGRTQPSLGDLLQRAMAEVGEGAGRPPPVVDIMQLHVAEVVMA